MKKHRLSEERQRRLEELRAKYHPKPPKPPLTLADIKQWRSQEHIGYQRRDEDYWRVHQGEAELVSGEVMTLWTIEEPWLPLRCEVLDHCPSLDIPPDDYWDDAPLLA